jgi:aminoglycoside 3-N-acetyltransferase I
MRRDPAASLQITILRSKEELLQLIAVFEEVFEREPYQRPGQGHLDKLLQQPDFFAVIAKMDNKVIGGMTMYVLDQYYSEKPLAYLYDLAVATNWQRQGIGKNLIAFTNEYCRQKGFEEVFVQADKEDEQAIEFYRSTQPAKEAEVVHFTYQLG